ncbi:MAG: transcriptional repressor [Clostridia bacterium]|nr:transcriptional repressor [Clostridia bacterium]
MTRGTYNTRQKRELLGFLQERSMQHFSVDEVVFELRDRGEKVGRSTVYRYLEQLAEQGSVRKYTGVQGVTQYQHVEHSERCDGHFHMMCSRCGNLMHVDCGLMQAMSEHLTQQHGFRLDPRQTILVGVCDKCRAADGEAVEHGADCDAECHHCL